MNSVWGWYELSVVDGASSLQPDRVKDGRMTLQGAVPPTLGEATASPSSPLGWRVRRQTHFDVVRCVQIVAEANRKKARASVDRTVKVGQLAAGRRGTL